MKKMNQKSAGALTWFAGILFITGGMIMSPSGALFLFVLAALCLVFPAIFGSGRLRIVAAILLFAAIGLAVSKYPDFKNDQERDRRHGSKSSIERIDWQPDRRPE
ncbi:MAG: DUF308 domain-containing protein, partial [Nitrospirota bacterium]|nr:DUF308 domain-containing protein [Nitrospirota bacterium]